MFPQNLSQNPAKHFLQEEFDPFRHVKHILFFCSQHIVPHCDFFRGQNGNFRQRSGSCSVSDNKLNFTWYVLSEEMK